MQLWRNWSKLKGDEADAEGQRMNPDDDIKQASASEVVTSENRDTATSEDDARGGAPLTLADVHVDAVQDIVAALGKCSLIPTQGLLSVRSKTGQISDRVGLILPTSLCSGQVATLLTERLNAALLKEPAAFGAFETSGMVLGLLCVWDLVFCFFVFWGGGLSV